MAGGQAGARSVPPQVPSSTFLSSQAPLSLVWAPGRVWAWEHLSHSSGAFSHPRAKPVINGHTLAPASGAVCLRTDCTPGISTGSSWVGIGRCKERKTLSLLSSLQFLSLSSAQWRQDQADPEGQLSRLSPPASPAAGEPKKEKEAGRRAVSCSFPFANRCDPLCNFSQLPLPGPSPLGLLVTIFSNPGGVLVHLF